MSTTNNSAQVEVSAKSGDPNSTQGVAAVETTTTFVEKPVEVQFEIQNDKTPLEVSVPSHSNSSLAEFLARPILIKQYTWTHGSDFAESFDPWDEFLNNSKISPKVANYYLFRGKMHVKFMINGNPFHFSRVLCSYRPLGNFSPNVLDGKLVDNSEAELCRFSQYPFYYELNPCTNTNFVAEYPFVYPTEYITLPYTPTDMNVTNYSEVGRCILRSFASLDTANSQVIDAYISVYAWCTDVELIVPTNASVGDSSDDPAPMAPPRGTPPRENRPNGLVSSISSSVASAMGHLSDVPVIGPFAAAGQGIASVVGGVAELFGFSRPTLKTDPIFVKNQPVSSIANVIGNETVTKLTFDPLQALTDDLTALHLPPEDQMSIRHMSRRWANFAQFGWDLTDAANTNLFFTYVYPGAWQVNTFGANFITNPTPVGFCTFPFQYWTGSLEYRIVFLSSNYHAGRVRISYEPEGTAFAATNTNTTYNMVVDLSEQTEVVFNVAWAQDRAYKRLDLGASSEITTGSGTAYQDTMFNGRLDISVVNPLVAPTAGANITCLVFIRAGDDFELTVPRENLTNLSTYDIPAASGTEQQDRREAFEEDQTEALDLVGRPSRIVMDHHPMFYFGERFTSFRALLKRYFRHRSISQFNPSASETANFLYKFPIGSMPCPMGRDQVVNTLENFWHDSSVDECNYVNTTLMTYLAPAFVGWRGGIRWKFLPQISYGNVGSLYVAREDLLSVDPTITTIPSANSDFASGMLDNVPSGWTGGHVTHIGNQPVLEWETPFYNNLQFCGINTGYWNRFSGDVGANPTGVKDDYTNQMNTTVYLQTTANVTALTANTNRVNGDVYVGAGDDFAFIWFKGAPTMQARGLAAP